MDILNSWEKALNNTRIIRPRVQRLLTDAATNLSYMLLSESSVNPGDTAVRKGEVLIEKPYLIMPSNLPQFEGFEFEGNPYLNEDAFINFLLVRGVTFPSLKYNNRVYSLDVYEGRLEKAIEFYSERLQREENVYTGLITGPEDCWQFSVLIFICTQAVRSAEGDIKKLLADLRRKGGLP